MRRGRPSELVLFLSVGFFEDSKIAGLTPVEQVQWIKILVEQLRSGNGSELPGHAYGVSRQRIQRYLELGLLEREEDGVHVHKWDEWNGREAYKRFLARERKRRQRRGTHG